MKDFVSAAITKKKKADKIKSESAASPLKETIDIPKAEKLKGTDKVPEQKLKTIEKPKSEDLMSIDLVLNAAKKKKKPEVDASLGPTNVDGKIYGGSSESYKKALKKFKKG